MFHSKLVLLLLFIFLISCKSNFRQTVKEKETDRLTDYSIFTNPTNEFRSHPFYSINDSLTEEEISRQIKDFKQAGFGGFYLHSRSGLITEFLGSDWWKIMQASVDAANDAGLRCMFYDEDKWPSGYAGGIIPRMSEDYRVKCLARLDKKTPLPVGAEIIAQDSSTNYVLYTAQFGWDIFNGTCYVDLFNPEAVQAFIDVSYRPYADKYRDQIKTYTPAIFSDEPHVHARYFDRNTPNLGTLSYSPWLEKKYRELYGSDLRAQLPLLYEEKGNWREVRMNYYRAKALLFEESYTKQLAAFCAKNDMVYTGHYLAEEVLEKVRDRAGNTMLHYRSMQQPGMDNLGLTFKGRLITARNLSSVANQFGKEKRLTEIFGISGQNMNFEDRKWLAGWHSILGINHFCPHLTLYSMKGLRKRDYPPTFSYQQPYWDFNKKIEDYLGRISYVTTIGNYDPQLLVISPLESEYIKAKNEGEFTSGMLAVLGKLQAGHYDYDVGDEQIMADTALVEQGHLIIGKMSYRNVILPDMISIRQRTLDFIQQLQKEGGLVFNTGRFPEFIDGKKAPEQLDAFRKTVIFTDMDQLCRTLQGKGLEPAVQISGNDREKVWSQTRISGEGKLVELFNTSHTDAVQFKLKTAFPGGNVILWDPSSVKCYHIHPDADGNFRMEIGPSSNIWITSGNLSEPAKVSDDYSPEANTNDLLVFNQPWKGKRLSPNALTLDFARYSTDNGKSFSQPEPVIGIMSRLTDHNYSGKLILEYPFEVESVPKNCRLVVEQPKMFSKMMVNGKELVFSDEGYFTDRTFRKTDISNRVKEGKNTIRFELNYQAPQSLSPDSKTRYGTEIESIYLIGDFGVKGTQVGTMLNSQRNLTGNFQPRPVYEYSGFTLTTEKSDFDGELTENGYPFYAGAFEMKQDFSLESLEKDKKYYLELPDCEAIVSVIEINGQPVDTLVWSPFKTVISTHLKEGENSVKIILVNSLRNLLGPHHHKQGELVKVGPNSFTGAGGFPDGRGEHNWYDTRLHSDKNPIWTDKYMNIPFGFLEPVKITTSKN